MKQVKQMDLSTEKGFQDAIKWTRAQLGMLEDGGVWVIPQSMSAVRIVSHRDLIAETIGLRRMATVGVLMRVLGWKLVDKDGVVRQ